jgi:3-methyladenine DNA glycosylase AlkD
MSADRALIEAVRRELATVADPGKAAPMQAYMKSSMPYFGVQTPALRRICRSVFAAHPLADRAAWQATVLALWRGAAHREERYVAIELTGQRRYAGYQDPDTVPLYEELVVTGAWWDLVDVVAVHRIGPLLRSYAEQLRPLLVAWSVDGDLWKRRTAIICQIASKAVTDVGLLAHCIEANLPDRDFFIRKAIGWSLREYAKTDPGWVRAFVAAHDGQLSGLSRREALKGIP